MSDTEFFAREAQACRAAAGQTTDPRERGALLTLARHYEDQAKRAVKKPEPRFH